MKFVFEIEYKWQVEYALNCEIDVNMWYYLCCELYNNNPTGVYLEKNVYARSVKRKSVGFQDRNSRC